MPWRGQHAAGGGLQEAGPAEQRAPRAGGVSASAGPATTDAAVLVFGRCAHLAPRPWRGPPRRGRQGQPTTAEEAKRRLPCWALPLLLVDRPSSAGGVVLVRVVRCSSSSAASLLCLIDAVLLLVLRRLLMLAVGRGGRHAGGGACGTAWCLAVQQPRARRRFCASSHSAGRSFVLPASCGCNKQRPMLPPCGTARRWTTGSSSCGCCAACLGPTTASSLHYYSAATSPSTR